jgi:hypothetical protein
MTAAEFRAVDPIRQKMEAPMMRLFVSAVALMLVALPASAQTGGTMTAPSGQNSGAGIPGQPGNKNGPPAHGSMGTSTGQSNESTREQDSAKIPGMRGNKSGPAAHPPSR